MALTRPRYSNIVDTDYKASVRFITTTNITLSGGAPNVVDGLNLQFSDRILVAGQSTASENGIYTVQTVGTGSNGTWIRSVDAGASDRVTAGMRTFIAEGVYAGSEYRLVTPDPIILGNTSLSFQSTAATVAGVNKGVQYNNAGFIAGATNLVYDNISGNVVATATTTSTDATTGALVVVGGVGIGGPLFAGNTAIFNNDVTIRGNLYAQGNTYITTSTDLAIQDSILNLHTFANLAPLTVNDGKDIGLKFHYYQGAGDDHAFIGRVNTTGYLEWLSAGEETSGNVFTGTAYGTFKTGNVLLVANTYRGSSTIEAGTQTYIPQFARSSTPPASPQLGDHWYDTSTDVLYKWFSDGTSSYWIDTLGTASTVTWSSQSTQPISPSRGDLWYDTSSDALYTYVFDGTSSYWVDYTSTPSSIAGIGALLSNVSVGNISAQDITANSITVVNTYGNIAVNNSRGQFVLGNDTRDGVARYITNTTTSIYAGMSLQRAGSEIWFSGVNQQENYVIRNAGTTDTVSIGANNTVTFGGGVDIQGNLNLAGNLIAGNYANIVITTGAEINKSALTIAGNVYGRGGVGYLDAIQLTNNYSAGTNPNKYIRVGSTGTFEIINSAYTTNLFNLTDAGALSLPGPISISGKKAVNGPAFGAYAEATLQTIPSGAQTKVLFQTEEFDTDGCYASSRFTPNVEGYYQLNAEVRLDGSSGTGEIMIVLYKNTSEHKRGTNQSGSSIGTNFFAMTVSALVYANGTTDYFEIKVQQTSGGSMTVTAVNNPAITWFNGAMVRGA